MTGLVRLVHLKKRISTLVLLSVLVATPVLSLGPSPAGATASQVTITRDSVGIPHITAPNFYDLGYGEAWAFSQDDFCVLAQDFVTVEGDRSEYFGPSGLSYIYPAGISNTDLDSDLFWKGVAGSSMFKTAVGELSKPAPLGPLPQVKALLKGYTAGYNAYLASGKLNDPTCMGKPWVRPITLTDVFLRSYELLMEASGEQFITYEVDAAPPAAAAAVTSVAHPSTPNRSELLNAFAMGRSSAISKRGSNGVALGSADTAGSDGMVLINPHFPWEGSDRQWVSQLSVPGQYDVFGDGVSGDPLNLIGFNQHVAWTHTSSSDFHFTFYQLKLVPHHPTEYVVDGKPQKMATQSVVVNVGGSQTVSHTFYSTRWGTVFDAASVGLGWSASTAYAVDDSMQNMLFRAANQYFQMGRATSVQGILAVQSKYLATPFFNTIAADDTGHVYYGDVENTPNVPLSMIKSPCVPAGIAKLILSATGIVTLDGSRAACAWKKDRGTPIPGILDAGQMPHTIRTDYVENSNDTYWLANPSHPFHAFSPIIGNVGTMQDLRTRQANQMIAARMAGTDGLGAPKFTLSTLQAMDGSEKSMLAQLVLPALVKACQATPTATASDGKVINLTAACQALAGYDGTGNLSATGGWLFSEWSFFAPSEATTGSAGFWSDAFNAAQPLTTPSTINTTNPKILSALADAVENLQANGIPLDASFAHVQSVTLGGTKIAIPGCATGCFSAIAAYDGTEPIYSGDTYGQVVYGNSVMMTVELTKSGPMADGVVAYSEASNPNSPWHSAMTTLYSEKTWAPLAYTPAQLASESGLTTMVLTVPHP